MGLHTQDVAQLKVMNRRSALIFDMDGTLWDGVQTYTDAWNAVLQKEGHGPRLSKTFLDSLMGLEEEAFLEAVVPDLPKKQRKILYQEVIEKQYELILSQGGKLYPGMQEGLAQLAEYYDLFIVSNCPEFTVQYFMQFAKIGAYIKDHRTHGQRSWSKAKNIQSLIEIYKLNSAYYIGDTQGDANASAEVGIPFVYVSYGFGQADNFHLRFSSFDQLCKHFMSVKG